MVRGGASCTIIGVAITGSIQVTAGSSLTTVGPVRVFGTITATDSASIDLGGKLTVSGGFSATNVQGFVKVGPNADIGSAMLSNVKTFILQGKTALLSSSGPGDVIINGGAITGGGLRRSMTTGALTLCGATIAGGVSLGQVIGDFTSVATRTCLPSSISGTISVGKGKGDVRIAGGMLTGADVLVSEQEGNIHINNARVSDLSMNNIIGTITLDNIVTDSDGIISGVAGKIILSKSSFGGDLAVNGNGAVSVTGNNFGNEVVSFSGNKGPVDIVGNTDMSAIVTENTGLTFSNNKVTTAEISKNLGAPTVQDSSFTSVSCADNTPTLIARRNTATFATGQCAGW